MVAIIGVAAGIVGWWGYYKYNDDLIFSYIFAESPVPVRPYMHLASYIDSWREVAIRIQHCCMDDNGRLANYLAIITIYAVPDWLRNVGCGIVIGLLPIVLAWAGGGKRALRRHWVLVAIYVLTWVLMPWHNHFDVFDFFMNYVVSSLLLAFAIGLIRSGNKPLWLLCALVFVVGWMHESYGVAMTAFVTAYAVLTRRRRLLWVLAFAFLGFAASFFTFGRTSSDTFNIVLQPSQILYHYMQVTKFLGLAPCVLYLVAVVAAYCVRRLRRSWPWPLIWSLWLGAAAAMCVAMVTLMAGRVFTPTYVCIIITLACVLAEAKAINCPRWLNAASSGAFVVGLVVFFALLVPQQHEAYAQRREMFNKIYAAGPNKVIFSDTPSLYDTPSWTVFGYVPQPFPVALEDRYCAQEPYCIDRAVLVMPDSCRRLPYTKWPRIAGDSPLRGGPLNIFADSLYADQWARVEFGADLPSQPPHLALLRRIAYGPEPHTLTVHLLPIPIAQWPVGDPNARMLYLYEFDGLGAAMRLVKINKIDFVDEPDQE